MSDTVLLDTSVAALLHSSRKKSDVRARYIPHILGRRLAISFQTVAELWLWAEKSNWGPRRCELFDEVFIRRFMVIPYDYQLARTWARTVATCRRAGRRMSDGDAWIAATAIQYGLPLLAHDRDFIGLPLQDLRLVTALG